MYKSFIIAGMAKFLAAIIGLLFVVIVTRSLTDTESGFFLLGITLLSILATVSRLGCEDIILRQISSQGLNTNSNIIINRSLYWTLTFSIIISLLIYYYSYEISLYIFHKPNFITTLKTIAICIIPVSLFMLIAMGYQALGQPIKMVFFQNTGVFLTFIVITVFMINFKDEYLYDQKVANLIYLTACFLIFFICFALWKVDTKFHLLPIALSSKKMFRDSNTLWWAGIMALIITWGPFMISSAYTSAEELAHLNTAQRTAGVLSIAVSVFNTVIAPKYAKLWQSLEKDKLRSLSKRSGRLLLLISIPITVILLLLSEQIMSIFGPNYKEKHHIFQIIIIGQFINILTAPAAYLLNMTENYRSMKNASIISAIGVVIISYLLITNFGAVGAALSISIGIFINRLVIIYFIYQKLRFFPIF